MLLILVFGTAAMILIFAVMASVFPVFELANFRGSKGSMAGNITSFKNCIDDAASWNQTVQDAGNPDAIRCPLTDAGCTDSTFANIRLRTPAAGAAAFTENDLCIPGYDPLRAADGFTTDGVVCHDFSDAGNPACPYRVEFNWAAYCPAGGPTTCGYPTEVVVGVIKYKPGPKPKAAMRLGDGVVRPRFPNTDTFAIARGALGERLPVVVEEVQPAGTPGGACVAGDFRRRLLNTVQFDPGFAVQAMDGTTGLVGFKPGIYECSYSVPSYMTGNHFSILRINGGRILSRSGNAYSSTTMGLQQTRSYGFARFTLTAPAVLAIDHFCSEIPADSAASQLTMGVPQGLFAEVYSVLRCTYYLKKD